MAKKPQIVVADVEFGIKTLADMIIEGARAKDGIFITSLAGGSGSGKSTNTKKAIERLVLSGYNEKAAKIIVDQTLRQKAEFARELESRGLDIVFISADNYYKGGREVRRLQRENLEIGFDDPEAVDHELLRRDVISLRNRKPIKERIYTFGDEPGQETARTIEPPKILILEGLYMLRPEMIDLADLTVFFDIGLHGWLLRRILRDPKRTGQNPADILHYCATVVEPKYRKWILGTKKLADIVIVNEYNPQTEAKNTGKYERQIKFQTMNTEAMLVSKLSALGAENLTRARQTDTYYNPHDRDLTQTGESIRIRREHDRIVWTYKGPKLNGRDTGLRMVERPKYEFEISGETMDAFLAIYGKEMKVIEKTRTFFLLGALVVTVDNVKRIQNGIEENLGIFLEFKMNSRRITSEKAEKRIAAIMQKLGVKDAVIERRSYVEM